MCAGVVADRRASVSLLVALLAAAIIGFVALGSEIVLVLADARRMQSAEDAAALAAVTVRITGYPNDYTEEASAVAAASGFTNGQDGAAVTVNSPPASGHYTSANDAVEVLISQPQILSLVRVVYAGPFAIHARSVARINGSMGACALTLETGSTGYSESGGSTLVNFVNCDLVVDSTSAQAISLTGGSTLDAKRVITSGNYSLSGGSQINADNGIVTGASATSDPYTTYSIPSFSGCQYNNYKPANGATLSPGVYCNGLTVQKGISVTLNPGIYIVDRGSFTESGTSNVTGTGVTIVLTSSTGSGYATASISGGSSITLSAPTSGPTAGLIFFQDRRAPTSGTNTISGGSVQTLTGALYFPSQAVNYSGGSTLTSQCTQIVARTPTFSGGATLSANCAGTGVLPIGGSPLLVE